MKVARGFYKDLKGFQKTDLEIGEIKAFIENSDSDIDDILDFLNDKLKGYGVEAIQPENAYIDDYYFNTVLLYVNMADTYSMTVCYDTQKDRLFIGSWGDWYERSKYCQ